MFIATPLGVAKNTTSQSFKFSTWGDLNLPGIFSSSLKIVFISFPSWVLDVRDFNSTFGYYSTKKNESIYKVKDLDKLESGDKIKGTACIGTSTITNKKLIKFINKFDNNILKEDLYFPNNSLCIIYQLVLRRLNDKKTIYFLRPSFYNLIKL